MRPAAVRVSGVSTPSEEDLSRVTIISTSRRVDLALPGSVTLSELMPSILRFSGLESNTPTEAVHAWVLQRFGSDPFDLYSPISKLNIRDGETLHLRHRENAIPDAAFDDVVDAVAGATNSRPSWAPVHSQRVGITLMMLLLIGAPLLGILGWPRPRSEVIAADPMSMLPLGLVLGGTTFLALACAIASIALARAARETVTATALAWASVALAGITGWFAADPISAPGVPVYLRLLLAGAFVLVASASCALAARVSALALFAAALAALFTVIAASAMTIFQGKIVDVAAITMVVMAFLTTFLPTLSYRIAGIALPNLPMTTEAMLADETPVQSDIVNRALLADRLLGAMLAATSLTAALAAIVVVFPTRGLWPTLLTLCVGLAFLLRARAFVGLGQRLALLVGGVVCVGVALGSAGFDATRSGLGLVAVFLGLLVLGYGLAHYSARTFSQVLSPTWGCWGDVFEWLAIIGVIPTLLGVLDLYSYFASRF